MFEKAMEIFNEGNYDECFALLQQIIENKKYSQEEIADAYNLMGAILIGPAPHLAKQDEVQEAISFFKMSLEKDSNNLGALLNVIETFGEGHGHHLDKEIFIHAYEVLMKYNIENVTKDDIDKINRKYVKYFPTPLIG